MPIYQNSIVCTKIGSLEAIILPNSKYLSLDSKPSHLILPPPTTTALPLLTSKLHSCRQLPLGQYLPEPPIDFPEFLVGSLAEFVGLWQLVL